MYRMIALLAALAACSGSSHSSNDAGNDGGMVPADGWSAVSTGNRHSCGIKGDGSLWCWGGNDRGQLGVGMTTSREQDAPTRVGTDTWIATASSTYNSCAIRSDHTLWCWGDRKIALGVDPAPTQDTSTPVEVGGTWNAIAADEDNGCGIQSDGALWCWGGWGESGDPDTYSQTPKLIDPNHWLAVTNGFRHTCAIRDDETLYCFGSNDQGQLGIDTVLGGAPIPTLVDGAEHWKRVEAGYQSTCAITTGGHLRCWGWNFRGQVGLGNTENQRSPMPVLIDGQDLDGWVDIAVGRWHSCGVRGDGTLWCWGDNAFNQSSQQTADMLTTPTQVMGAAPTWRSVSTYADHTCAIADDHSLWCVGADGYGQLGDGGTSKRVPTQGMGTWDQIVTSDETTCGLDSAGIPECVGKGLDGALGNGAELDSRTFVPVTATPATPWTNIAAGGGVGCTLAADSTLWCWGGPYPGVGPTTTESSTPRQVGTNTWSAVVPGRHSCAIDATSSKVYCWGYSNYGEAGCGAGTPLTPRLVASTATWSYVAVGGYTTCGVSSDGVMCWGTGSRGQLGDGSTENTRCEPGPVAGSPALVSLVIGQDHVCGLVGDGHGYCWGYNLHGQIGNGSTSYTGVLTPFAIPNQTWRQLAVGESHTCGIATDGSLWCWGANDRGQVGDGTDMDRTTPTRVGTDTDWATIDSGDDHVCATRTDHTVWCWGANDHGQLGDGTGWRDQYVQVGL